MEIIILGIVLLVLFIITWIVILCNSAPDIAHLPYPAQETNFKNTYEYASLNNRIRNLESGYILSNNPLTATKTHEQILRELTDNKLLEEARKRGLLELKETIK